MWLLSSVGCPQEELVVEPPQPPPAVIIPQPPLEQITDPQGWLTQEGSLSLSGASGERKITLTPPLRIVDVRATAWHLFLLEQQEPGGALNLKITDLASGTTCGVPLPARATGGADVTVDIVRGEHILYRLQTQGEPQDAYLFNAECKDLVHVSARMMEISPDKAFLATYPTPDVAVGDEPAVRLYDLELGIQLGNSYPIDASTRVTSVVWSASSVEFVLTSSRELPPIRISLPP